MKYESTILKRLIDTYGVVGNPRYISEIIKEFIVRGKERFPELFTYQADWLAHIDEFGLNPSYTVSYTGESIYAPNTLERPVKSAILSGSTKYHDIDTGEFLETFEEGRNLELVSVKMPVLTTTGKNLFDGVIEFGGINSNTGLDTTWISNFRTSFMRVPKNNNDFIFTFNYKGLQMSGGYLMIIYYNENKERISSYSVANQQPFNFNQDAYYYRITQNVEDNLNISDITNIQLEKGTIATPYEPYKSNILTVNEDVTLRSNGNICDELNLLTRQLTQRIDEDGEVLSQEVIKTVELTILDHNGQNVKQLMSFNGGTHFTTSSQEGSPLPSVSVSVETDLEEALLVCSLEGNTV